MNLKKETAYLLLALLGSFPVLAQTDASGNDTIAQIEQSQAILTQAKNRLEQMLLTDIPLVDTGSKDSLEKAKALSASLASMAVEVKASNQQLAKIKDQLLRTQSVYQAKDKEFQIAQSKALQLQTELKNNTDHIAKQEIAGAGFTAQIAAMASQIENASNETIRLNEYIARADAEVSRRKILAAEVIEKEEQHLAQISAKQKQLNVATRSLAKVQRQLDAKNRKVESEKENWAKVDKQIADRATQQDTLNTGIQSANSNIASINAELLAKSDEIAAAKVITSRKREELVLEKKQIPPLKKRERVAQQEVRAANKKLSNSEQLLTQELALKDQLIQEIADTKSAIVTLKRSEIDMQAEISQLDKLLDQKNQDMAPLRAELDALRAQKNQILEDQSLQQNKVREINKNLVAAEEAYQSVLSERRNLENEKIQLQAL